MNIDGNGTSCLAWYGELIDISENSYESWDLNVRVDATELGDLLHLLAFFVNFHYCLFHLTNCGLIFFFWSFSYLHKEVQRFSWPQKAAGYYNNFSHGDSVSGMLDRLYMPNEEEEEENIPLQKKKRRGKQKVTNHFHCIVRTNTEEYIYIYISRVILVDHLSYINAQLQNYSQQCLSIYQYVLGQ